MSIIIETQELRDQYFSGETLRGTVAWKLPSVPEKIHFSLEWLTDAEYEPEYCPLVEIEFPAGAKSGQQSFELELPLGPFSYEGKLFSIKWYLKAVSKKHKKSCKFRFMLQKP